MLLCLQKDGACRRTATELKVDAAETAESCIRAMSATLIQEQEFRILTERRKRRFLLPRTSARTFMCMVGVGHGWGLPFHLW